VGEALKKLMRNFVSIPLLLVLMIGQSCISRDLSETNVEAAVEMMLRKVRIDGEVSVKGVQELPQQNAAIADLSFKGFEYAITFQGQIIEASKYRPTEPNTTGEIPSMEQMFPGRKATYSGPGKATLKQYNDGRWVLERVDWGPPLSGLGLVGNIELNSSGGRTSSGELLTPTGTDPPRGAPFVFLIILGVITAVVVYIHRRNSGRQVFKTASPDAEKTDGHTERFSRAVHEMAEERRNQKSTAKPDE